MELELGRVCVLRVQVWTLTVELRAPYLIQTVTRECTSLLHAVFAMRDVLPYREWVACPHCLAAGRMRKDVTKLPVEELARKLMKRERHYACGSGRWCLFVFLGFGGLSILTSVHLSLLRESRRKPASCGHDDGIRASVCRDGA